MATPAWVRNHRRVEHLTSKLIRTDQAAIASERYGVIDDTAPGFAYDEITAADGTVIRRGMAFSDD